jgi:hypothetical protein
MVLPTTLRKAKLLTEDAVLLRDNTTATHTAETLRKLKSDVMVHLPFSPDLARSDYHLSGPLKEALRGRWFTLAQEVK